MTVYVYIIENSIRQSIESSFYSIIVDSTYLVYCNNPQKNVLVDAGGEEWILYNDFDLQL